MQTSATLHGEIVLGLSNRNHTTKGYGLRAYSSRRRDGGQGERTTSEVLATKRDRWPLHIVLLTGSGILMREAGVVKSVCANLSTTPSLNIRDTNESTR
jgi:hypothetical protein